MKKVLMIMLASVIFVIISLFIGSQIFIKNKIKPNDIEDLSCQFTSVEEIINMLISYNDGKDYVFINDQSIKYGGYDEYGNNTYVKVRDDEEFVREIKNYFYKENLQYLDNDIRVTKAKWSLEISKPTGGCIISGIDETPEWFNRLLEVLEVDKFKN